jgi:hypothetical protein
MGLFRNIEDWFSRKRANTVAFSEGEKVSKLDVEQGASGRMEVLRILTPFFGEIGKMIFQHHGHW